MHRHTHTFAIVFALAEFGRTYDFLSFSLRFFLIFFFFQLFASFSFVSFYFVFCILEFFSSLFTKLKTLVDDVYRLIRTVYIFLVLFLFFFFLLLPPLASSIRQSQLHNFVFHFVFHLYSAR